MEKTVEQVMSEIPRREIRAFSQWFKSLPKGQTAFLYQTFDSEELRVNKLKELYKQYQTVKRNKT